VQIIEKPWGRELWVGVTDQYALKIIEFKAGNRSSLQYHARKHEHIYIDRGRLGFELENDSGVVESREMGPGDVVEVFPGRKHRVTALEDVRLFEVSTPELDDVVRVEDDHGR
jgi:mannose-6-phosphate isomerase